MLIKNIIQIVITIIILNINIVHASQKIILSTGEYPPLNSSIMKYNGLMPRIVKAAFAIQGVNVVMKFYPWKRAYQLSKIGKVDGTIQWLYSESRKKDHYYSNPILEEKFVWFHLKSFSFKWKTLKDLKNIKIGAISGYTYSDEFYTAIKHKEIDVKFANNDARIYNLMLHKEVQVFPEHIDVGCYRICKVFSKQKRDLFTYNKKAFIKKNNYLLISRKRKNGRKIIKIFNKGLAKLKESGKYNKYILESRKSYHVK